MLYVKIFVVSALTTLVLMAINNRYPLPLIAPKPAGTGK